jgi:hypothetical protein
LKASWLVLQGLLSHPPNEPKEAKFSCAAAAADEEINQAIK